MPAPSDVALTTAILDVVRVIAMHTPGGVYDMKAGEKLAREEAEYAAATTWIDRCLEGVDRVYYATKIAISCRDAVDDQQVADPLWFGILCRYIGNVLDDLGIPGHILLSLMFSKYAYRIARVKHHDSEREAAEAILTLWSERTIR